MHPLVHDSAFGRKTVFVPRLLDMDKGALPLAENKVLQGGDGEEDRLQNSSWLPAAVTHLLTRMIELFGETALL